MTATGAAAAIAPEPEVGSGPVATADDVITLAELKDRERQLVHTGACSHPVRLHGRVTALDLATGDAASSTTPPPNRAGCCMSRAATAANHAARPARRSTSAMRGSSSARA